MQDAHSNPTPSAEPELSSAQPDASVDPSVAIVIPTCNRSEVLGRCLSALATQTHRDFEVVVVDDASTDNTPQVVEAFAQEHPQRTVHSIRHDEHQGANPGRMNGVRASNADLVAFLDCDCIADPDWLKALIKPFRDASVGATTGLVEDPDPTNIFELAFMGTHRVAKPGPAPRLIAGNMCIRRTVLNQFPLDVDRAAPTAHKDGSPDVSVSGRGDEEGLFVQLLAANIKVRATPDARVLHDDAMAGRRFWRQAWRGGRSAARFVYKFRLTPRLDMLPFILAYATIPLAFLGPWLWLVPALFAGAAVAAISWNELTRKGKSISQLLRALPILLAYYHVRLTSYVAESLRLRVTRHDLNRMQRSWKTSSSPPSSPSA